MLHKSLRRILMRSPATIARPIALAPIGVVRNDRRQLGTTGWDVLVSRLVLDNEHAAALAGLEGFTHIIVLTWLDRVAEAERGAVVLNPRAAGFPAAVGVFALRVPARPNPIGMSIVRLLGRDGPVLTVCGLDAIDGTPLLDLKPYLPRYDSVPNASLPDWATRD
jgi:tRNA-Thr(GGU) m(6)t(6)A37 methyltransferase TsaA